MLSSTAVALALREAHYAVKRFASELDLGAPGSAVERIALGPTWQYGAGEDDVVRYTDGQVVTFADGRAVEIAFDVVFAADDAEVGGVVTVQSDPGEQGDADPEAIVEVETRTADSDGGIAVLVDSTVERLVGCVALLDELGFRR